MYNNLRIVHVVNRTLDPLDVTWNGAPKVIPPGYKQLEDGTIVGAGPEGLPHREPCEYYMAEAAKRQHPVKGTLDPEAHNSYETYIGVVEWNDDISHRGISTAIELLDRSLLPEDRQNVRHQHIPGARKDSPGRQQRRRLVDADAGSGNPMGMRGEYSGGADYTK